MSWVLVLYFYYMQAQQLFFRGEWSFLRKMKTADQDLKPDPGLTLEERTAC